jgi:hypothetical protein
MPGGRKHLKGYNGEGKNIQRHNICGTKCPGGQKVSRETKRSETTSIWIKFLMSIRGNINEKSIEHGLFLMEDSMAPELNKSWALF